MAATNRSKTVQLYCPSNNKTVDRFVISPYQTFEQVLQGIRLAVETRHAALYTVVAKPIASVETIESDQRILVAVTTSERMLPDAPLGYVLYDGEEGHDIDPNIEGFGQPWEVCSHRTRHSARALT